MENKSFNSDRLYSTYWWEIKLNPNHAANYNRNVTTITGYSKAAGHDEAKDKYRLLMNKIRMLYQNGYFEKSNYILIYMNQDTFLDKRQSRKLLRMTIKDYSIHNDSTSDNSFYHEFFIKNGILKFLTQFYERITNGHDIESLFPKTRPTFSKEDNLDITKHNFPTKKHLYAYCNKMVNNGYSFEAVMHFQRRYEENKPFDI